MKFEVLVIRREFPEERFDRSRDRVPMCTLCAIITVGLMDAARLRHIRHEL